MSLAENRKLFILIASMGITYAMNRLGFDAKQLGVASTTIVGELAPAFVDLAIIGGVPAVLTWAQPNELDDSIFRWWKAVLVGCVGVAALIGIIVWVT